jgi:hypothetical protein
VWAESVLAVTASAAKLTVVVPFAAGTMSIAYTFAFVEDAITLATVPLVTVILLPSKVFTPSEKVAVTGMGLCAVCAGDAGAVEVSVTVTV